MPDHRAKNWVFTINNYDEFELTKLSNAGRDLELPYSKRQGNRITNGRLQLRCLGYQSETGERGTPHIQGFVCFSQAVYFSQIEAGFTRGDGSHKIRLATMRGTPQENATYCSKGASADGRVPYTFYGDLPPGQGGRTDLSRLVQAIREGAGERELFIQHGEEFLKFANGIKRARLLFVPARSYKTKVCWCFGPTGSGKSRWVNEVEPGAYWKDPTNHWWDGYDGQESVIVDDYRRDFSTFSTLLRLLDRYPLTVQVKGGTVQFAARRIYFTSPVGPGRMWESRTAEDLQQLFRRIEVVLEFPINETCTMPIDWFNHN